jgi:hypothetical protein
MNNIRLGIVIITLSTQMLFGESGEALPFDARCRIAEDGQLILDVRNREQESCAVVVPDRGFTCHVRYSDSNGQIQEAEVGVVPSGLDDVYIRILLGSRREYSPKEAFFRTRVLLPTGVVKIESVSVRIMYAPLKALDRIVAVYGDLEAMLMRGNVCTVGAQIDVPGN